ncbi:MAG TPA: nicotinamide-nucleotide amidohydrolase family protein [Planctomycetota bacterium]|nr:nicotinamide-nucleotide amidohydrolase family protein [Planctomycetota bacterium]
MPNAILCVTGSELTRGETKDLNGPFLATTLSELGVRIDAVHLLPDDRKVLEVELSRSIELADVVIVSGGLGPTADDLTVEVLARVLGRKIVRDPRAVDRMRARALARGHREEEIPANFFKQAEVLEGVEVLLNPVGLAPGMVIPTRRGLVAVLPGVPREMQPMFRDLVVPAIRGKLTLDPPRILRVKVMGQGESWAEARVQKLGIDFGRVEYGISAKPGELLLKFIAHEGSDHAYIDLVRARLEAEFERDLILLEEGLTGKSGAPIEVEHSAIVHRLLLTAGATVATAESCTGGMVAKSLTDHAGSSAYFLGSVVAYSNAVKERVLGVPGSFIEAYGAVSREVAEAMAAAARDIFGARFGIGITGIAGPGGGTPEKPVGLVHLSIASRDPATGALAVEAERHNFAGPRDMVRTLAAVRALDLLRRRVSPEPI